MTLQTILHKLDIETISVFNMLYYRLFTSLRASHFLDHRAVKKLTYIASSYVLERDFKKDSWFSFPLREILTSWARDLPDFLFYDAKYWLLDTGVVCYEWILETTNPSMSGFFRPQSPATGTCTLYMTSCFIQVPRYFSRAKQDLPRISEGYEGPVETPRRFKSISSVSDGNGRRMLIGCFVRRFDTFLLAYCRFYILDFDYSNLSWQILS